MMITESGIVISDNISVMGFEREIEAKIVQQKNLSQIKRELTQSGWQEVNFGFQLGRQTGALDLRKDSSRYLVYLSSEEDRKSFEALQKYNIPRFPLLFRTKSTLPDQVAIAEVPLPARSLDSLRFPDQKPAQGYLGSLEIMMSAAKLLSEIFKTTSMVPYELRLNKLALLVGQPDIIRLVPPLDLRQVNNWKSLIDDIKKDLSQQDPQNLHGEQVRIFGESFRSFLERQA